jgi:tRNA threonylcarbamoyladenosine biosynthesis protein TsaB
MKLAIDTSTRKAVIAIESDGEIVSRRFEPRATQKVIFGELASMLDPDTLSELDGIVIGLGPGSFTGVKIGVMAAKTLAWSRNIRIVGVGSLDAVASSAPTDCGLGVSLIVVVPSTRGEAYLRIYGLETDGWHPIGEIIDTSLELNSLNAVLPSGKLLISGEATEPLAQTLDGHRDFILAPEDSRTPSAEGLFLLARSRFESGETDDPLILVPDYIRLSQPERSEKETGS